MNNTGENFLMITREKAVSRIAPLREAVGLTQLQLAVLIGVTPNTIQNWEKGKSGVDQIEKFLKLCEVLGCGLADLVQYVPDPEGSSSKHKEFSLHELRQIREKWGTNVPETEAPTNFEPGVEDSEEPLICQQETSPGG